MTWKNMVTTYSPDNDLKVYDQKDRWSDKRDPLSYAQNFDFSQGFFNQFNKLYIQVPKLSIMVDDRSENSDYSPYLLAWKNCYLCVSGSTLENCHYCFFVQYSKDCMECTVSNNCEVCYQCVDCIDCYMVFYAQNLKNCRHCYFVYDCQDCEFCFGCVGLRTKRYCIYNKECSKEEYENFINSVDFSINNIQDYLNNFNELEQKFPHRFYDWINNENVSWNFIYNCKDCYDCFDIKNSEDAKCCYNCWDGKTCSDSSYFMWLTLSYEWLSQSDNYLCLFVEYVWRSKNVFYSSYCFDCSDLFGCVGLHNKQYCIFNKQYTREEYEREVAKIIWRMTETGEWWEFFPASICPFGYNETVAQEYFPLAKEEALKKGFKWNDYEVPLPMVDKILKASELPSIKDVTDEILNQAIECEISKKPFKIIKPELEFYRKHNLPLPKRHPDQRHIDRMNLRNPRKLFDRACAKCGVDIQTTYAPERPEKVYCEKCYNKEVYG